MKGTRSRYILLLLVGIIVTAVYGDYQLEYHTNLDDDLLRYCNRQTAYSTGVSDARKGLARKEDFAQVCRTNRADLNAAYTTGYNYGLTNQSGIVVNEPAPYHPEIQYQLPSSYVQPYTRPPQAVPANPNVVTTTSPNAPYVVEAGGGPKVGVPGATSSDSQASRTPLHPGEVSVSTGDLAKPEPVQGLNTLVEIRPSAQPKCIESANHAQACGFNCVNSMNNVRCAATPDQVCMSNDLGLIACGYHCISTRITVRCALYSTDLCVSDTNGNVFCGVNCRIEQNGMGICDLERYAP